MEHLEQRVYVKYTVEVGAGAFKSLAEFGLMLLISNETRSVCFVTVMIRFTTQEPETSS